MPRSNIRAKTIDVIGDDGSLIISIAQGEQLAFQVTCDWITDMENYTATFSVIEGDNVAGDLDEVPFDIRSGATAEDIALMRAVVGPDIGVKASGGVRTAADARKMIAAGADRLAVEMPGGVGEVAGDARPRPWSEIADWELDVKRLW